LLALFASGAKAAPGEEANDPSLREGEGFLGQSFDYDSAVNYSSRVIEVRQTNAYAIWFDGLRDGQAKGRIQIRIRRLSMGLFGDAKFFGGIGELRIDYGPGYRVYFVRRGEDVVVLLGGGDKKSQARDIAKAQQLAKEL
jgi:putative addiction module killer protein